MRCYEIRDVLTEFIEGSLPEEQAREVADHIARCKACERDVRQMEQLIAALRSLPPADAPSRLRPSISDALRAVAEEQAARVRPLRRRYLWLGGGLGAAAAAAVFLGIVFGLRPALLQRDQPVRTASAALRSEKALPATGGDDRLAAAGPAIDALSELELEEAEEEAAEEAEDATIAEPEAEPDEEAAMDDEIRQRAEAAAEALRARLADAGIFRPEPRAPTAEEGGAAAAVATPSESRYMFGPEAKPAAPTPPSARARGLWLEDAASIAAPRTRMAKAAGEEAKEEEDEEETARVASAPVAAERRTAFMATRADMTAVAVKVDLRPAASLQAGKPGELLVTVRAERDVRDAQVKINAPKDVRFGRAYEDGVAFRGGLTKGTVKTISIPIVPQKPGTKTFKAEVSYAGRRAAVPVAEALIPVVAARSAGAPAGRAAGPAEAHTIEFANVDLHVALREAASEAGIKVQIGSNVPRTKITYSAAKKPIAEIMKELAAKGGCQATLKADIWAISRPSGGE